MTKFGFTDIPVPTAPWATVFQAQEKEDIEERLEVICRTMFSRTEKNIDRHEWGSFLSDFI